MTHTTLIKVQTLNGYKLKEFKFDRPEHIIFARRGIWSERLELNSKQLTLRFDLTTGPVTKRGKRSFLPFIGLKSHTQRKDITDMYNFQISSFR